MYGQQSIIQIPPLIFLGPYPIWRCAGLPTGSAQRGGCVSPRWCPHNRRSHPHSLPQQDCAGLVSSLISSEGLCFLHFSRPMGIVSKSSWVVDERATDLEDGDTFSISKFPLKVKREPPPDTSGDSALDSVFQRCGRSICLITQQLFSSHLPKFQQEAAGVAALQAVRRGSVWPFRGEAA